MSHFVRSLNRVHEPEHFTLSLSVTAIILLLITIVVLNSVNQAREPQYAARQQEITVTP